jgi:glutamyl-tRNA reductase
MQPGLNRSEILLLGVNHKSAPVEVREKLALRETDENPLELFSRIDGCDEVVFLSTCNRVELVAAGPDILSAAERIRDVWAAEAGLEPVLLDRHLYRHHQEDAVRHLFMVASSLDSMIVGEPQILGQLKDAFRNALESDTTGQILTRLFQKSFTVAKRIRTETRIASQAVSISFAAVELARKIFGDLGGKTAMLIGAGEMAELAAQHLKGNGVEELIVVNRTLSRAVHLARELDGRAMGLDELDDALTAADIVISSTGAPGLVVMKEQVRGIMRARRHRLLFFIDIAVPRDIDPGIEEIDNAYVYDIDALKEVVEENRAEREKEAVKARRMVNEEVIRFLSWQERLDIVPVIRMLQAMGEEIRRQELERSEGVLGRLGKRERKSIEAMTRSIVSKMLHNPVVTLKSIQDCHERQRFVDVVSRLYRLDDDRK